tara:strand:+ start:19909 stop:20301 length:393 start_codon:yes stop_codon:yes gene_type:complete
MKTLRQIIELKTIDLIPDPDNDDGSAKDYTNPKGDSERAFVKKHIISSSKYPGYKKTEEEEAVFKATNVKKDVSKAASYHDDEDEEVYESAVQFVRDHLTEDNLKMFDELLESDRESAIKFANDVAAELI